MAQRDFINDQLIGEIGEIVKNHAYLSFGLISSGIELLGILIDQSGDHFFKIGLSSKRFRNAIDQLFPISYQKYNNINNDPNFGCDLYTDLRCGLSHSLVMKSRIGLSERKHNEVHLSERSGMVILVVEDFYENFVNACNEVIRRMDHGEIKDRFSIVLK